MYLRYFVQSIGVSSCEAMLMMKGLDTFWVKVFDHLYLSAIVVLRPFIYANFIVWMHIWGKIYVPRCRVQ